MTSATVLHTVNMSDVDAVQVNFARFFLWMDDAYMALLRACGHPLSGILADGFGTPAVHAECDYRRPVGLDDAFSVTASITGVGTSSFTVEHVFDDGDGVFAVGRVVHVWIALDDGAGQRPDGAPAWLRSAVENGRETEGRSA